MCLRKDVKLPRKIQTSEVTRKEVYKSDWADKSVDAGEREIQNERNR